MLPVFNGARLAVPADYSRSDASAIQVHSVFLPKNPPSRSTPSSILLRLGVVRYTASNEVGTVLVFIKSVGCIDTVGCIANNGHTVHTVHTAGGEREAPRVYNKEARPLKVLNVYSRGLDWPRRHQPIPGASSSCNLSHVLRLGGGPS